MKTTIAPAATPPASQGCTALARQRPYANSSMPSRNAIADDGNGAEAGRLLDPVKQCRHLRRVRFGLPHLRDGDAVHRDDSRGSERSRALLEQMHEAENCREKKRQPCQDDRVRRVVAVRVVGHDREVCGAIVFALRVNESPGQQDRWRPD